MSDRKVPLGVQGIIQISLGGACFGVGAILVRFAEVESALTIVVMRALFATFFLWLYVRVKQIRSQTYQGKRATFFISSVILALTMSLYYGAIRYIPITPAVLLVYTYSPLTAVVAWVWLKEPFRIQTLISIVLAIAGAYLVVAVQDPSESENYWVGGYYLAGATGIVAAILFNIPDKYFRGYEKTVYSRNQIALSAVVVLPVLYFYPPVLSAHNLTVFAAIGLVGTAAAMVFIYRGSDKIESQWIGVLQGGEFIIPMMTAPILFSERVRATEIIGAILLATPQLIAAFTAKKG